MERGRRRSPREWLKELVLTLPIPQTPARRAADSAAWWAAFDTDLWLSDSHVKGGVAGWDLIGQVHHGYFLDFARAVEGGSPACADA